MSQPRSRSVRGRRSRRGPAALVGLAALAACAGAGVATWDGSADAPPEKAFSAGAVYGAQGAASAALARRPSGFADAAAGFRALPPGPSREQIERGRQAVLSHACGECHGGGDNPAAEGWLAGNSENPIDNIAGIDLWARNLTPDDETGLGRVSERQIFNALRFGLRPSETPDIEITSALPGEGNHPASPIYLGPDMPWTYWRYMSDQELRDIAAYLKHGLKPVPHEIPERVAPADGWASQYTVDKIGTHVLPAFPTDHEELGAPEKRDQVLRGRELVAGAACSGCHGGALTPDQENWLTGITSPDGEFHIGDCADPDSEGCFTTRPRNLTPHNTTGIGRFTERQIFNALRFGLRPGETPDVEITSTVPGEGNFPTNPKYLAPPMPWPAWRNMSDQDLWDIAAYLKYGLKPVDNKVEDSEGPPDFWAGGYTVEAIGPWPAADFPTANEVAPED